MSDSMDEARQWLEGRRAAGFSDEEIRAELVQCGWSEGRIDELMGAGQPPPPPEEVPPEAEPARPSGGSGVSTVVIVLAVAGCGLMAVAILAILAAILFPVFARAREKARQASCLANLKQIGLAQLMYAQDYDQMLPDADQWPETTEPYIRNRQVYLCPADEPPSISRPWSMSYTMNQRLSHTLLTDVAEPNRRPLCYDGSSVSGGPDVAAFRHVDGANCTYVDGHAKMVPEAEWETLWEPGP
ncbi:MAG: DUF1559 domain-containing protein [Armatimonadota bacterium]|nr:DUF1559 domain-containing protein [Armatimonadota bacterium]